MNMKRMIMAICMMVACQLSPAQTVDALFRQFRNEASADYVHVPKMLMKFAAKLCRNNVGDTNSRFAGNLVSKIDAVRVLDLDDCPHSVKGRFINAIGGLDTAGYEELIRVNDDGQHVRILTKSKRDRIRELVVVNADGEDCQLVQLKVNVSPKEIDRLINGNLVKKDK